MQVRWVMFSKDAKVPTRKTKREAGFDLYALKDTVLDPGIFTFIPVGVGAIMDGCYGVIFTNSHMKSRSLFVINGVIDQDYIHDLGPVVLNGTNVSVQIQSGEMIGQILFFPQVEFETTVLRDKKSWGGEYAPIVP